MLITFATINSKQEPQRTHRGNRSRTSPASPRPVTMASRPHIICTATISGKESRAVHSGPYPKVAPATE